MADNGKMSRKSNSENFEAGRQARRDGSITVGSWNKDSAWRKGYDFEDGIQDHKDGDTRISWNKDSDYGKGYDHEGRRQEKKQINDSINFVHDCLGFSNSSKPLKPSRSSGSSGGGGVSGSSSGSGLFGSSGIFGAGIFVIVVILLFGGAAHSSIVNDKSSSSVDVQMEHQIGKWVARSDLIKNCDYSISLKAYDIRTIEYERPPCRKTINWAIVEICFIVGDEKQDVITIILLQSCGGTDCLKNSGGYGWRVVWRSDKDIMGLTQKYEMVGISISKDIDVATVRLAPLNFCDSYETLYVADNGEIWGNVVRI